METNPELQGVVAALAAVKAELEELGWNPLTSIKFDRLTHATGIGESTLRKLFAGEPVSVEEVFLPFKDLLRFLRETRLHPDGREYSRAELAEAAQVDPSMISNLLSGKRQPGFETSRDLANHFNAPGFFTIGPEKALITALEPVLEQARLLAELKGQRVERVALRGSLTAGSDELSRQLGAAIQLVVASADDDPELRELTDRVRSLPESSRKGVLGIIRSVLGIARKEG